MLNCCSSSQCWSMIPSLMQAWIRYPIPSLFGSFAAYRHQYSFYALRTLSMSFGTLLQILARGMPLFIIQSQSYIILLKQAWHHNLILRSHSLPCSLSPPIFFLCSSNVLDVLRNFIIGFGSRHAALSIRFASWPKQSCAHYNKDFCL